MSLYNALNGFNPACLLVLPMLGKHPDDYPRFRDCFAGKLTNSENKDQFGIPLKFNDNQHLISIYMRIGGINRPDYIDEIQQLRSISEYVEDYDDSFDSTFATFVFTVPDKWKVEFHRIIHEDIEIRNISDEYKEQIKTVFPKLREHLDNILKNG